MIDGPVTRQVAQFRAVREHHGRAVHPLDDLQPVTRGQQIELAIRPVDDDALARGRPARLMSGEIGGEVRPPAAVRVLAVQPKRGEGDEGGGDDDEARGLYAHELTTLIMLTWNLPIGLFWTWIDSISPRLISKTMSA